MQKPARIPLTVSIPKSLSVTYAKRRCGRADPLNQSSKPVSETGSNNCCGRAMQTISSSVSTKPKPRLD